VGPYVDQSLVGDVTSDLTRIHYTPFSRGIGEVDPNAAPEITL
jgi:hypothetical protein